MSELVGEVPSKRRSSKREGRGCRWDPVRDWLYPYVSGAGRGASVKYRHVSGRWRRRVLRRTRLIAVVLLAPALLVPILEHRVQWLWAAGIFLGGLIGGYIARLDSPPAYIENWRTGLEGERRTARALAPLRRRGFVLLHDLPDRAGGERTGNIDHVVISPAGVFLLDSKLLGGDASILGETVHVQMRDDDKESYELRRLARGMRGRAVRLQEDILAATGVRFVTPVVVFWNRFDAGVLEAENVVFLHGSHLASWLEAQPAQKPAGWAHPVGACIHDARPNKQGGPNRWRGPFRSAVEVSSASPNTAPSELR
jgi:Nuclease-related domain